MSYSAKRGACLAKHRRTGDCVQYSVFELVHLPQCKTEAEKSCSCDYRLFEAAFGFKGIAASLSKAV